MTGLLSTKERILSAALETFGHHGFAATTTRMIAGKAGVAEKTLFEHFPTKKELHETVIRRSLTEMVEPLLIDSFLELVSDEKYHDLRTTVMAIADHRVRFAEENPAAVKLIAQEFLLNADFRERMIELWDSRVVPQLRRVLDLARSAGELRPDVDDESALEALLSVIVSHGLMQAVRPFAQSQSRLRTELDVVLRGLSLYR